MTTPLSRALREHGDALAATIDTLAQLESERWSRPWAPGKWTGAQIAEHLILVYEGTIRDLTGGRRVRARFGPGLQRLLRVFILPHILFHRSYPVRARAPREWRPGGEGVEPASALPALTDAADRFEDEASRAHEEGRSFRHPYFGDVDALRTLRLAAVHLEHHRRQLVGCLTPDRATRATR